MDTKQVCVVDTKTGTIIKSYNGNDLMRLVKMARRYRDRLNNEYGAYRYLVHNAN